MFLRPQPPRPAILAALLAAAGLVAAQHAVAAPAGIARATFAIVEGAGVKVTGGESACFRLVDTSLASDRLLVRVRFQGRIPRGNVSLDGTRSEDFREAAEEFSFVVDPRGTHRVRLNLEEPATIDRLSVTSTGTTLVEETCATYESSRRDVDLQGPAAPSTNRLGQPEPEPAPAAAPSPAPAPAPAAPMIERGTLPAGSTLAMTLQGTIDTRSAYAGQAFRATLDRDVMSAGGRALLPAGSSIEGRVVETQDAGRFGHATLKLAFDTARLADGTVVPIAGTLQHVGKGSAKKQGAIIGGSAVGGAILGKILGGSDKDAAWGAVAGGAIAAGSIAAKPGEPIVLPAGTALEVTLDAPAEVPARPAPAPPVAR